MKNYGHVKCTVIKCLIRYVTVNVTAMKLNINFIHAIMTIF